MLATSSIPGPWADVDVEAYNSLKHNYICQLHKVYGDIVAVSANSASHIDVDATDSEKLILFVRDPKAVHEVLHNDDNFAKTWDAADSSSKKGDYVMNLVQPLLSNTVFNNVADRGKPGVHKGRTLMKATFGASEHFLASMEACVERLLKRKAASWCGEAVDVQTMAHDVIRRALLVAVVGDTIADEAADMIEQQFHEVMQYFVRKYADSHHKAAVTKQDSENLSHLEVAMLSVVRRWYDIDGPSLSSDADHCSLLRVMHKAEFDEMHCARMLVNTIIAGGEAPAIALAATIEELARTPPVQDGVIREVAKPAGLQGSIAEHVESFQKVDDTVLEGLRLFSPATLIMRVAVKDSELCGYVVPAGTVIGVCVTAVHQCPHIFENSMSFEPEKRSGLNYVLLSRTQPFVPFSAGPRGCPGKHIGTALLRICLAKLLQHFHFKPPSQGASSDAISVKFTGWKVNGIHLRVGLRELPMGISARAIGINEPPVECPMHRSAL